MIKTKDWLTLHKTLLKTLIGLTKNLILNILGQCVVRSVMLYQTCPHPRSAACTPVLLRVLTCVCWVSPGGRGSEGGAARPAAPPRPAPLLAPAADRKMLWLSRLFVLTWLAERLRSKLAMLRSRLMSACWSSSSPLAWCCPGPLYHTTSCSTPFEIQYDVSIE